MITARKWQSRAFARPNRRVGGHVGRPRPLSYPQGLSLVLFENERGVCAAETKGVAHRKANVSILACF